VWLEVAGQQLGQSFVLRIADRRSALDEPGRDPSVVAVAEKAKVEVRDDLVGIEWLGNGHTAAASVGFISLHRYFAGARRESIVGTGFLVGTDRQHVMTCYHVIEARDPGEAAAEPGDLELQVRDATIAFDYTALVDSEARGTALPIDKLVAFDAKLDYAILRLAAPVDLKPLTLFGGELPKVDGGVGFVANIVQHPLRDRRPQPKQLGLRNNAVWKVDDQKLYYFTDTRSGSSGSPVFSDGWKVLAIHTGYDVVSSVQYMGRAFAFANRGTLMRRVAADATPKLGAVKLQL
jgi:hypothetical protein